MATRFPTFQYQQLNPSYQSDAARMLGAQLQKSGLSTEPVRTPLAGLGRLSKALVGAYLQKGAMDRQVAREDERTKQIMGMIPANASPEMKAFATTYPMAFASALGTSMFTPRTTTSITPGEIGGEKGLITKETTDYPFGKTQENIKGFSRSPVPKTTKIIKGSDVNTALDGFTLQANYSGKNLTGYTVLNKPEKPGFKNAIDLSTSKPVFVSNQQLEENQDNYIPIIKNSKLAINPDGTVNIQDSIFTGDSNDIGLTKSVTSTLQKDIVSNVGKANKIADLIANFKPEYFKYENQFKAKLSGLMEKSGATLDEKTQKSYQDFTNFMSRLSRISAVEINEIYGAVLSGGEEARAQEFIVDRKDSPTLAYSKLKQSYELAKKGIARKQYILKNGLMPKNKSFRDYDTIIPLSQFDKIIDDRGAAIELEIKNANPQISDEELNFQVTQKLSKEFGVTF